MDEHDAATRKGRQRIRMTRKQRRLTMIGGSLAVLAVAAALVLNAMRDPSWSFPRRRWPRKNIFRREKRFASAAWCSRDRGCAAANVRVAFAAPAGAPSYPSP